MIKKIEENIDVDFKKDMSELNEIENKNNRIKELEIKIKAQ